MEVYFTIDPAKYLDPNMSTCMENIHISSFSPEFPKFCSLDRVAPLQSYSGITATHKHSLRTSSSHIPQDSFLKTQTLKENQ